MFISLGELNKKCLLFILVPILVTLRWFLESQYNKENKNLFFNSFLRFFSCSINLIPWIFLLKTMDIALERRSSRKSIEKEMSKDKNDKNDNIDDAYYNVNRRDSTLSSHSSDSLFSIEMQKQIDKKLEKKKKSKNRTMVLLSITGILFFVSVSLHFILSELNFRKSVSGGLIVFSTFIRTIILVLLSNIFIKSEKMYRHHRFSGLIICLITILFLVFSQLYEKEKSEYFFNKLVVMVIPDIGFAFMYIIGLRYLIGSSGNVYKLLFYNGFIGMILSIFVQIIISFFNCPKDFDYINYQICDENGNFRTILFNLKSFQNFGLISIFIIIVYFFENICIFLLIYNFSINHFAAIFSIPTYFQFIIEGNALGLKLIYIIGSIIIIFMTLVYNEIIILKFLGFETNTKIEIVKRAKSDTEVNQLIQSDKLFDMDENEDF